MIAFFSQFIRKPRQTGAILPTARALSDLITDLADLKPAKVIVEFGPGTGVFTEKILAKKDPQALFLSLEINPVFVNKLKNKYPDLKLFGTSAEALTPCLKQLNQTKCDRIVSGLPWAAFTKATQTKILTSVTDNLEVDGLFLTFAYIHSALLPSGRYFRRELQKSFLRVEKSKIIWSNFPPAFVYVARGVKG